MFPRPGLLPAGRLTAGKRSVDHERMDTRNNGTRLAPAGDRLPPDPSLTADDILQAAEDLVPLLRERAVEADRDRRIEPDTYRRLEDAGFFHILKPGKYGGLELSEHEHAKVAMTPARGCASTAWVFSILSSDNMAIVAYPEQVQEEIWGTNPYATLAGNTTLNPKARAERVPGGYRLTGQWGFCSGSDFSEWLIFNAPAGENGEGHMFLMPRENGATIDDWFPTGMRATGSRSIAVEDVFVPDYRVQATRDTVQKLQERRTLHPTFDTMYAPWPSFGRFTFASTAVGAAWGAAEHFAATVASATRVNNALGGEVRLADQDYVAAEFADAAGEIQMAMTLIERRSFEASERARQRRVPSEADLARENRDNALVTRVALRSVNRIFSLVGSKAGRPEHPVSRAKRDIELASHHVTLNWRQSAVRYLAAVTEAGAPS
jgi:alkylation response protein AidB-like acyl-CoA dehydrogenase